MAWIELLAELIVKYESADAFDWRGLSLLPSADPLREGD